MHLSPVRLVQTVDRIVSGTAKTAYAYVRFVGWASSPRSQRLRASLGDGSFVLILLEIDTEGRQPHGGRAVPKRTTARSLRYVWVRQYGLRYGWVGHYGVGYGSIFLDI